MEGFSKFLESNSKCTLFTIALAALFSSSVNVSMILVYLSVSKPADSMIDLLSLRSSAYGIEINWKPAGV